MFKIIINFTVSSLIAVIMITAAIPLFAQEEDGVNSTNMNLSIHGGGGYGSNLFGVIQDSSDSGDLGIGPGGAFTLGAMFNYSVIAIGSDFTKVYYNDMEFEADDDTAKTEGDGYFRTLEFIAGFKLFTEEGDMGYTLFYGGYKMWKAKRNVDSATINGIEVPEYISNYELEGDGWIAGCRDLSTFNLKIFSLALQMGLWYEYMPMDSLKNNGVKSDVNEDQTAGLGFEIGLGAAFENIGLSVMAVAKVDVTATSMKNTTGDTDIAGAGYAQFFLTVTKDFSI